MKVFFFLTLIAFGSTSSIGKTVYDSQTTIKELKNLLDQAIVAAKADCDSGIDHIVALLGDSGKETTNDLQAIVEQGVGVANNVMNDLVSSIDAKGDNNVKDEAITAIQLFQTKVVRVTEFEQRAVRDASSDQKRKIDDYIEELVGQCSKDFTPLIYRINQLTQ